MTTATAQSESKATINLTANREGMLDFLSQSEKMLNTVGNILEKTGTVAEAIMANVLSTYLGLFALALHNGKYEVVINHLYPLMEAYCTAVGTPDAEQDLANFRKILDGFIEEIEKENKKPVFILMEGGSQNN